MSKIDTNITEYNILECLYCPSCSSKNIQSEYPIKDENFLFNYKISCFDCNKDSKVFNNWFNNLSFWECKKCWSYKIQRFHLWWFQACKYECLDCKNIQDYSGWKWIKVISDYEKNQFTIEKVNKKLNNIISYLNNYIELNYWEDAKYFHGEDISRFYRVEYNDNDFSEMCKFFKEYDDIIINEDIKFDIFLLREYGHNHRYLIDSYFNNINK
jgi:hypothetical protein